MRRREAAEVVDMNIALWIAQILLALIFIFAGVIKFVTPMEEMMKQMPIALPAAFIIFTGIVEVLGGVGVILPWLLNIRPGSDAARRRWTGDCHDRRGRLHDRCRRSGSRSDTCRRWIARRLRRLGPMALETSREMNRNS